jgi:hypothetical protein
MFANIKNKIKKLDALDRMIFIVVAIIIIWKFVYGEVNFDWLNNPATKEDVEITGSKDSNKNDSEQDIVEIAEENN